MKKIIAALSSLAILATLAGCSSYKDVNEPTATEKMPSIETAFGSLEEAQTAGGGWYQTMNEGFDSNSMPENWHYSPHGIRKTEYWCDNMVKFENGNCVISAATLDDNNCDICPKDGQFTSGIETRYMDGEDSIQSFAQAFGYYEAKVKFPVGEGMWSAFWLQSNFQRKIGNEGKDGTEMDIFESAFTKDNSVVAHALLWDGYGESADSVGEKFKLQTDLYDGYHTFGLLWTPTEYTFFVDGKATWTTDGGGVSQVPEFLRLTCEIRDNAYGAHGVKMKKFTSTKENPALFYVDYVNVYQNTDFLSSIKSDDDYQGTYDTAN